MAEYRRISVGDLQTNCYLIWGTDRQAVLVDPGAEPDRIRQEIEEAGVIVTAILLTHVHFDHILAVQELQSVLQAPLLVPQEDVPALTNPYRSLVSLVFPGRRYALQADRELRDGDEVTAGQLSLRVLHTPGHTPGSSCYLAEELLVTGDTLFAGGAGRTDFPGGDEEALAHSLRRLAALPADYTVLPGHDALSTLERERRSNPYCLAAIRRGEEAL